MYTQKNKVQTSTQKGNTETNISDDIKFRKYLEGHKFIFETAKHLTTLNTGLIVIFTSLVAGVFHAINIIALSQVIIPFLISTMFCLILMAMISLEALSKPRKVVFGFYFAFLVLTITTFAFGLACLLSYAYIVASATITP